MKQIPNYTSYLPIFQKAAAELDNQRLRQQQLTAIAGVVLDSVYLKIYKPSWSSDQLNPLSARSRIFFSIWVNQRSLAAGKILYNIHALKLRELKGYSITSRAFAEQFRAGFKNFQKDWNNVSVDFGPLTLMEGWEKIEEDNLQPTIVRLAESFIRIESLIEKTLEHFQAKNSK